MKFNKLFCKEIKHLQTIFKQHKNNGSDPEVFPDFEPLFTK
nr:MAG TPA: hypothetical protein [Caudoviricetes sp.]DAX37940.1 MAG TPA: hypothetical protein [Caudoviricetes sp.]